MQGLHLNQLRSSTFFEMMDTADSHTFWGFAGYYTDGLNMFFTPKDAGLWEDLVSEFFNNPDLSVDDAIDRLSTIVQEAD